MASNLTPPYSSPEFKEAFEEFRQHRKEIKPPLTPVAIRRLYAKLGRFSEEEAIFSLGEAIDRGWQTAFPQTAEARQRSKPKHIQEMEKPTKSYADRIREMDEEMAHRRQHG